MQILRNENGRVGALDVLLGLLILGSVGFIAYSFLGNPTSDKGVQSPALSTDPVVAPQNSVSLAAPAEAGLPGIKWQNLHAAFKSIGDSNWSALPELSRQKVAQTGPCQEPGVREQRALAFWNQDLANRTASGDLDFVIEPTGARCFRPGLKLDILRYSKAAEDKYVSVVGRVEVVSVHSIVGRQLSDDILKKIDVSRRAIDAELLQIGGRSGRGRSTMTLVRIKPLTSPSAPPVPLAHIVFGPVGEDQIAALATKLKRFRVIDLRTESERSDSPIEGALLAPYQVPGNSNLFSWNLTNKEVEAHKFYLVEALAEAKNSNLPIILVGSGPSDGRPIWAIGALLSFGFRTGFWYLDGGSSLRNALGKVQFGAGEGVIPAQ